MIRVIASLLLLIVHTLPAAADGEPKWWEKRRQRPDIFFPHNAHMDVMKAQGDLCMACHPFSGTGITDSKLLARLNVISNEPMKAICHECHVEDRSAPMACNHCHPDPSTIRPDDHGADYTSFHAGAARRDEALCRTCHLDLSFCTGCHFRRQTAFRSVHPLGYRDRHGIEARMAPASCGTCHGARYCRDCHRGNHR